MRSRVQNSPRDAVARGELAFWCARAGDQGCAVTESNRAAQMEPENAQLLYQNAVIYCVLDRREEALQWLEQAVRFGLTRSLIEATPEFALLQELPGYQTLLELAS